MIFFQGACVVVDLDLCVPRTVRAWQRAADDPVFRRLQRHERDRAYVNPAAGRAKGDGLSTLGQFIYYGAMVMHGPGTDAEGFGGIRVLARELADTPSDGGFEVAYCTPFLDVRRGVMKPEAAHETPRGSTTPSAGSSVNGTGVRPPLVPRLRGPLRDQLLSRHVSRWRRDRAG